MLMNKLESSVSNRLVEDLLGVEYIVNNYGVSCREFVDSLAYSALIDKAVHITPWFGSSLLIRKAGVV